MKYGEKLYRSQYMYFWKTKGVRCFRYRIDPVPYISRQNLRFKNIYKTPKTMNEKRQWDEKFGRGKRSPKYLPDPWNDWPRADYKIKRSWKKQKKRKQWM